MSRQIDVADVAVHDPLGDLEPLGEVDLISLRDEAAEVFVAVGHEIFRSHGRGVGRLRRQRLAGEDEDVVERVGD